MEIIQIQFCSGTYFCPCKILCAQDLKKVILQDLWGFWLFQWITSRYFICFNMSLTISLHVQAGFCTIKISLLTNSGAICNLHYSDVETWSRQYTCAENGLFNEERGINQKLSFWNEHYLHIYRFYIFHWGRTSRYILTTFFFKQDFL